MVSLIALNMPSTGRWPRRAVLAAAAALFLAWILPHARGLISTQNGGVRFPLCFFLAALILWRRPGAESPPPATLHPRWFLLLGVAGAVLAIAGLVLPVGLFEWVGLLLVVAACLGWALPPATAANVPAAMLLLFWAHPLPARLFAPLQFLLQRLSVDGSEWLLQVLNRRVWADGMVLHTGLTIYEVPAWCSGMRTATTVTLAALGMGLLKRLRGPGIALLVGAALVQALALNIARIAAMVFFVPVLSGATGVSFLHDTAGLIVVLAVVLTYLEMQVIERAQQQRARENADLNPHWFRRLSEYPPIWRDLLRHRGVLLSGVVLLLLAAAAYKSRPRHRAEMVKGVVEALVKTHNFELADLAARDVEALAPQDREWRLVALRILMMRGEFDRVLKALDGMLAENPAQEAEQTVLRAYCLMAQGHLEEAAAAVHRLPEELREGDPRVAMVLAEMARFGGDPAGVAARAMQAAAWGPNRDRIRALYPYLRANRKWEAIAATDAHAPYSDPAQALCAAEAFMNLNDVPRVAALVTELLRAWPGEPRAIEPLYFLAGKDPGGVWEARFSEHLLRVSDAATDPDAIYALFDKGYAIGRPDLVWRLHRRIETLDPGYPGLPMNAAVNARRWFTFRKGMVGMEAAREDEVVDLRAAYRSAAATATWAPACQRVPYGSDLSAATTVDIRKAYLARALDEFRRRAAARKLSLGLRYEYVRALEMSGDIAGACTELDAIAADVPGQQWHTRGVLSEIYERRGDGPLVYETLRSYPTGADAELAPMLRLSRAQAVLHLGIGAVETVRAALELFPLSSQAVETLAAMLSQFDSPEEALLVLEKPRLRSSPSSIPVEAQALHRSQRFAEAARFSRAASLPPPPLDPATEQRLYLPPAEYALLWYQRILPSAGEFAAQAERLEANRAHNASPFIARLTDLWLTCYRANGSAGTADPRRWAAAGRDALEQAQLLNQLTLLLCRQGRIADARAAALQAAALLPSSPLLWRTAVSLSGPDRRVLAAARRSCPRDSELWLADLVTTTQVAAGLVAPQPAANDPARDALPPEDALPGDVRAWVEEQVSAAARDNRYSPAAMTRAADYLYRGDYRQSAASAAHNAAERARGLLPAYIMGLRCAIVETDSARALDCTRQAIASALAPPPVLYRKLVGIKSAVDPVATDNEMVEALKVLRRDDPGNPLWAQMLGYVRFQRGGWEVVDALAQMEVALASSPTNLTPYLVAAEAARQLDRVDRAVEILTDAATRFPEDLAVLNNLVYSLALRPETIPRALDLLPRLLERARQDVRVMDTASAVYAGSGLLDQADVILEQILRTAPEGSRSWFRARVRQAEVLLLRGQPEAAAKALTQQVGRSAGIPDEDMLMATRLLEEAQTEALRAAARKVPPPAVPLP